VKRPEGNEKYWIYILECENGAYYTGIARDIEKRYLAHLGGPSGAKFTRSFRPRRMAGCWILHGPMGDALRVEVFIKRKGRKFKEMILSEPGSLVISVRNEILPDAEIDFTDPGTLVTDRAAGEDNETEKKNKKSPRG